MTRQQTKPEIGEALHAAVCQAVALLNVAPEVVKCAEGRQVRDLLRRALVDWADAYMDQPVTECERDAVASKHRTKSALAAGAGTTPIDIDAMAQRLMGWKLPEDRNQLADCGASEGDA
jgi:hypothetical protein